MEDDNDEYGEYGDCYNSTIIAQNVPNGEDGTGSYSWTVPNNLTNRTNYVISVDDMYTLYGGASDEFTISDSGPINDACDWVWEHNTEGKILSSPAISGDYIYVGSDDNKVYCLPECGNRR